jgi:16S rRNA A1518/A1519 N6-dimethyltransferase RsmA/KsgA/DIM1 with predicted DNA glycosylase/AP lyase activity
MAAGRPREARVKLSFRHPWDGASSVSGRRSRRLVGAPRAQHFLGEAAVAVAIVETAGVSADDFVLEFGAGYGRLTEHLALRSGRVVAVETDARPAARLTHRFRGRANVTVVPADALTVPLPRRPFKVVSNPPFHITSALLHRCSTTQISCCCVPTSSSVGEARSRLPGSSARHTRRGPGCLAMSSS